MYICDALNRICHAINISLKLQTYERSRVVKGPKEEHHWKEITPEMTLTKKELEINMFAILRYFDRKKLVNSSRILIHVCLKKE